MSNAAFQLSFERHRLDNGLEVILHRDRTLPLVAINLWYHVGSKNERPGRTGFAHLFEHMLFQGSEHVGTNDHFRLVQQAGGVVNGSTWYDRTNYFETLPANRLDLGLWLESDRMGFLLPALTQEKLDTQRSVVINERRQRVDNRPYGRAYERLHELLYPLPHPYHWPVIGYVEDLEATSLEDVQEFFRTHYTPRNAVLTLAGDFVPEEALERIAAYFGSIPAPEPPPPVIVPELEAAGEQREEIADDVQLPRVYVGFRVPGYGHPDWFAADLLSTALASGKASPFYQDLVYRRQIAQEIGCFVMPTEVAATFVVVATCKPGVSAEEMEAALFEHLEGAAARPLTDEDVERARNQALMDHFHSLETLDSRANQLSEMATFFDDPDRVNRWPDFYTGLSAEDLRQFAARHLRPEGRVVLRFVPKGKP